MSVWGEDDHVILHISFLAAKHSSSFLHLLHHITPNSLGSLYLINFIFCCQANMLTQRLTSSFAKFYYSDILPGSRCSAAEKSKQIRFDFPHFQWITAEFACTLWCDLIHSGGISPRVWLSPINIAPASFCHTVLSKDEWLLAHSATCQQSSALTH